LSSLGGNEPFRTLPGAAETGERHGERGMRRILRVHQPPGDDVTDPHAVIFDMDGVLSDRAPRHLAAVDLDGLMSGVGRGHAG
jgi:hypothetical protein